jgi:Gcd10p family
LGKFGSFLADKLIGKPFGPSWEVLPNKEIKLLEKVQDDETEGGRASLAVLMVDEVYVRDNRDVFDDKTVQLLSHDEIRLARENMSSKVDLTLILLKAGYNQHDILE